jgi:hypothetical protein
MFLTHSPITGGISKKERKKERTPFKSCLFIPSLYKATRTTRVFVHRIMCAPKRVQAGKGKGKVHPRTGHESPEGSRYIALLFL